ncbi:FecR family protein [uncultured Chitinophaga sp.]|uniref:FecR family protein n=1 Tax=uncultured Chitinophaga sp. TaxID=339340 RepID=UPI0025CC9FFA|nr:FecR domain-containing protein [uncultured Chitinophaga sp.]
MEEQALLALIARVENGTATEYELARYNEWCNEQQANNLPVEDFGRKRVQMLRGINKKIGRKPLSVTISRVAAAAVLLVLVSAGLYRFLAPTPARMSNKEGLPGIERAMLTLADGSRIELDDAEEGELANQHGVKVVKLPDNQLAYEGEGNAMAYNTLETPRGAKYRITLPDGSTVWLNASSSLRFPTSFKGEDRQVELQGEAYFDVAKNASKPFKVKLHQMDVQVLGTQFNVMAYNDEPNVRSTLLDGSVRLHDETGEVLLTPGQQGTRQNGTDGFVVTKVNAADAVAWKNGFLVFENEEIETVMRKIARWYNVEVEISEKVAGKRFGGTISQQKDVQSVLTALEITGSVHFKMQGNKIYVMP